VGKGEQSGWPLMVAGVAIMALSVLVFAYLVYSLISPDLPDRLVGESFVEPAPKAHELDRLAGGGTPGGASHDFKPVAGAIMTLTIPKIGLRQAPVFSSADRAALNSGIGHVPETSLPWDDSSHRNVYLAGHRLGWPGTPARLIFYRLDELERGDDVLLEDDEHNLYRYRVSESFLVEPTDSWVMGEVRGRDIVSLQTCTLPDLDRRLIVRADRVGS
jgi:LPXTG-site transpeptidase (sortase) family protein